MWHRCKNNCAFLPSRLARALWIEMAVLKNRIDFCGVEARESPVDRNDAVQYLQFLVCIKSRLARALWIEIGVSAPFCAFVPSRLARALWIEINKSLCCHFLF